MAAGREVLLSDLPPELLTDRGESAGDSQRPGTSNWQAGLTVSYRKVNPTCCGKRYRYLNR